MSYILNNKILLLIRVACASLFFGRGWQFLIWDAPVRSLFWNQGLLKGIVESFSSMTWHEYATSSSVDAYLQLSTQIQGVFFILLGFLVCFLKANHKKIGFLLYIGSALIFLMTFQYFIYKGFRIGMMIEHALQIGTPLIFHTALYKPYLFPKKEIFIKSLIALTFVGHGLYAIGVHPVPGNFIDMVISVLGVDEQTARELLMIAGALDFSVAIFIFFKHLELYALGFNIFWGIVTAFARVFANFEVNLFEMSANQWVMETLYRLPHGLIPLALFVYLKNAKRAET